MTLLADLILRNGRIGALSKERRFVYEACTP